MKFTTLFFDLDDTLYPSSTGLWDVLRDRMSQYMWERLNIPKEEVSGLRRRYFETYGTTLRGLQKHYHIDTDEYLAYVHNVPLQAYLQPNPHLGEMIRSLPQRKWVFTNADQAHARRVISQLKLEGCFEGIIDIRATEFLCKPEIQAYERAMSIAGESQAGRCVLIEDSLRNLEPAHRLGFFTILVGCAQPQPVADLCLPGLMDLRKGMPELWDGSNG